METANVMVAVGGDSGNVVPKYAVTAAEIALLQAIHGTDAVFDVEPAEDIERSSSEELRRLRFEYATSRTFGTDSPAVTSLFPGAAARVFERLDELPDLRDEQYKAIERTSAKKAPQPAASKKSSKKAAEPEAESDAPAAFE